MSEPSVLHRILSDHGLAVQPLLERRLPPDVSTAAADAVEKALRCGRAENGFIRFRCEECGEAHTVCFRCKSRFCPTCGKARAAEAAAEARGRLLNVRHRHLVFAVPQELRGLLYWDRSLLSVVAQAAAQATLKAVARSCRAHPPAPGIMATVHTFGRDLSFHVHVHVLCTEGGLRADGVWQPVSFFPARLYRKLWQHGLLTLLRNRCRDLSTKRLIGRLYRKHPDGFVVSVLSRYRNGRKAAAYCCRYTGRPPLSEARIQDYDGKRVTFTYEDYRDGRDKSVTLPAQQFLLRLLQHVLPRYQRSVHYYGLYQPSKRKTNATAVAQASRFGDQVRPWPRIAPKDRLLLALGLKDYRCLQCGGSLVAEEVRFARKGSEAACHGPPTKGSAQLSLPV